MTAADPAAVVLGWSAVVVLVGIVGWLWLQDRNGR